MRRTIAAGVGGVTAAFLGALCCAGPLVFVTLGLGAGLSSAFEPFRPLFGGIMVAAFAMGFYTVYGRAPAAVAAAGAPSQVGQACALPRRRTREKTILWGAFVIALVLWTFPSWSALVAS